MAHEIEGNSPLCSFWYLYGRRTIDIRILHDGLSTAVNQVRFLFCEGSFPMIGNLFSTLEGKVSLMCMRCGERDLERGKKKDWHWVVFGGDKFLISPDANINPSVFLGQGNGQTTDIRNVRMVLIAMQSEEVSEPLGQKQSEKRTLARAFPIAERASEQTRRRMNEQPAIIIRTASKERKSI